MTPTVRNPKKLRCLLERDGDLWLAYCIDLCLAVQADSSEEARSKLNDMIADYVLDATQALMQGDEAEYRAMMSRKSPLSFRIRYHLAALPGLKRVFSAALKALHQARPTDTYQEQCTQPAC